MYSICKLINLFYYLTSGISMIDLRSDTVSMPTNEMKQFMFHAPIGDDVYGEDPSINELQDYAADLFGKEAGLFVPSGTMANLISVLSHCDRGDEVILGNKSHIFVYEAGGISAYGGIHSHQLNNNDDGTINIDDIKNSVRDISDSHHPTSKLLCLENTHNMCYGSPINTEYFERIHKITKNNQLKLHIDGARIFNAAVYFDKPVSDLVQYADSISCCLSKGLSCPAGSLILGNKKFISKAHRIRKSLGGGMRQAGIFASAGIFALQNMVDGLREDHANAKKIAANLDNIKNIKIDLEKIKTNIIFFYLEKEELSDDEFINQLLNNNIKIDAKGNRKFRIATHSGFKSKYIDKVSETINQIVNKI